MRVLSGLLRIAVGLDRSRDGVVKTLAVERAGKKDDRKVVKVVLDTGGDDADIEVYAAEARTGLLEDALGVAVQIEVATP